MGKFVMVPKGCYRIKKGCETKADKPKRKMSAAFAAAVKACPFKKRGVSNKAAISARGACIKKFFKEHKKSGGRKMMGKPYRTVRRSR